MKKLISLIVLLAILVIGGGSAFAHPNGHPGTQESPTSIIIDITG